MKLRYRRQVSSVKVQPAAHYARSHKNNGTSDRKDSAEQLHGMSLNPSS